MRRQLQGRLVVVSNRVADLSAKSQSGGLAVAVGEALEASGGVWFGWSGDVLPNASEMEPGVEQSGPVTIVTVPLSPEEHESFYLGFANQCLWPLFHYRLDLADLRAGSESTYFAVNKRFAGSVAGLLRERDTIWVHDYQLIPFAAYLRQRQVTAPIGFFLHIPFPAPEVFAALPHHKQLARTFFAYDLVGFQTVRDRENFARYAEEHLGGRRLDNGAIKAFGRTLSIGAFPIGIDAASFVEEARENAEAPELRALAEHSERQALMVGVERLDYTKGVPERIRGFEALLERWPEFRGRVQLLQIAPPTREGVGAYDRVRQEAEQLSGRVNGLFGTLTWTPIRFLHHSLPRHLVAGLLRRCRVGLVTPLRDGMNLVAKEYVAAQDPADPGVLVLSQFAGAAEQLEDALIVNPHDPVSIASAIRRAIEMPLAERRLRYQNLMDRIESEDLQWWRDRFLSALSTTPAFVPKPSSALRAGARPGMKANGEASDARSH
jgi:trehalose 6-phosphate synthase